MYEEEEAELLQLPHLAEPPRIVRTIGLSPIWDVEAAIATTKATPRMFLTCTSRVPGNEKLFQAIRCEADKVGRLARTTALELPTKEQVAAGLQIATTWWYTGSDYCGGLVFASKALQKALFVNPSAFHSYGCQLLHIPSIEEVVEMVAAAERLQLAVLNFSNSIHLGRALAAIGVRHVVCWDGEVERESFGCAFATALANGDSPRVAFQAAKAELNRSRRASIWTWLVCARFDGMPHLLSSNAFAVWDFLDRMGANFVGMLHPWGG